MACGAVLVGALGATYVARAQEENCSRVRGAVVEAVLLAHGAQRPETVAQYRERMAPFVAKGFETPDVLHKEAGWMVCPTFLPVQP